MSRGQRSLIRGCGSVAVAAHELIEQVSRLVESVKRGSAVGEHFGLHRPVEQSPGRTRTSTRRSCRAEQRRARRSHGPLGCPTEG